MPQNKKQQTDISENEILQLSPSILDELLTDHSATHFMRLKENDPRILVNIFWATDIYEQRYGKGKGFDYHDQITVDKITGKYGEVIQPRVNKTKEEQLKRVRENAEVFTPSWICNKQNNLVDESWFGRSNVFNKEIDEPFGEHSWSPTRKKILFPEAKTWVEYVREPRLEITCGEAPYLVSRYDTITGNYIPIHKRVGLLDRKMRIVNENCEDKAEWIRYSVEAVKSVYGFDWQGDNVLIAREAVYYSFLEYYKARFKELPGIELQNQVANIVAWNIWQMDGFKYVVPDSCHDFPVPSLFPDDNAEMTPCPGCSLNMPDKHNGIPCLIMDWEENETVKFNQLF